MKRIKRLYNVLHHYLYNIRKTQQTDIMLLGALLARQNKALPILDNIAEAEFKVFSQAGDDGIIQYLINKVHLPEKIFIEFGVENYVESNTRFLLKNNNWSGLVIDGSKKAIKYIKSDDIYYQYDLKALESFITTDNINNLIASQGISGEIGLLSIDIDGNDYWIWKAIDIVQPVIVVTEYNSVFGIGRALTIPYQSDFVRSKAHYSYLYFGSSLRALCMLAEEKGYNFVGSNSIGNNAYFIRKDRTGDLKILTPEEGYVLSGFRESRNRKGELNHLSGEERYNCIKGMPVFNVTTKETELL